MGIAENGSMYEPKAIGHHAVLVGFAFTTDASAEPTFTTGSFGGQYDHASVALSTGTTYVVTIDGGWGKTGSVIARVDAQTATPTVTVDNDASGDGTVTIECAEALVSGRCDVQMVVYSASDIA